MLILTRGIDESIVIAGDITVTVYAVKGNQVRIGVDAPRTVTIDRLEIHERKQLELETRGFIGNR